MNMGRRGLLKLMGMAPAVAAMAPAMGVQAAGYSVAGLGAGAMQSYANHAPSIAVNPPLKLFSFASWLKECGAELRQDANNVTRIDPDIACMRLPLQTKVRFQADRNYERAVENRRSWFDRVMEQSGHVEVWK